MIGATLGFYLARVFMRNVLLVFGLFFFLIIVVDLIELSRDLPKVEGAGLADIFPIALYRAPRLAENVLPFAVMFGASASLLSLNSKLELVVARASGVSVWQFLMPLALTAALLGAVSATIYNPVSLSAVSASRAVEAALFGRLKGNFTNKTRNFWMRVPQENGDIVIRARVAQNAATQLDAVSMYRFAADGKALDRIDAESARFRVTGERFNTYTLTNAIVTVPGESGREVARMEIKVDLTLKRLETQSVEVSEIPFWDLPAQAAAAIAAGRNSLPYKTQFQAMLSLPLLFVAMVLLAATVSLRFARFGQSGKAIAGGIIAGFVLYVASRLVITFGSNGLVPPFIAAWSPALIATLICMTVLLHQEDG